MPPCQRGPNNYLVFQKVHTGFDEHQEDYDNIVILCQDLLTESEDPTVGEALDEKLHDLGNKLVEEQCDLLTPPRNKATISVYKSSSITPPSADGTL